MRDDYTHITIVLDASGSMAGEKAEQAVAGINDMLGDHRGAEGDATISLYQFSGGSVTWGAGTVSSRDNTRRVRDFEDVGETDRFGMEEYELGGMTPLYDAMALAIDETGERLAGMDEADRPANVVVLTVTDGMENASARSADYVREKVELQTGTYGWEFMFIGANQDAVLTAESIGIDRSNSLTMRNTGDGVRGAFAATSRATVQYGATGQMAGYTQEDREQQSA
jgi:uncharacterized protein YegL